MSTMHERSILGALLQWGGDAWAIIEQHSITADDFHRDSHARLFSMLVTALEDGDHLDVIRACDRIDKLGKSAEMGGIDYVARHADGVPSIYALPAYCRDMRDEAQRRRLRGAGALLTASAEDYGSEVGDIIADAHTAIDAAVGDIGSEYEASGSEIAHLVLDRLTDDTVSPPISTGWPMLDKVCSGGIHRGHTWVWGARPRMGKTALALNMAWHVAREGTGVLFCSLEQPRVQVGYRLTAHIGQVPLGLLMERRLDVRQWDALQSTGGALEQMAQAPLWLDCTPAQSVGHIRAQVMRHRYRARAAGVELGVVIVDYLQRMRRPKAASRDDAVGLMAMGLADIAREMDVGMVILAQLNRAVDSRPGQTPEMADLRESGTIEAAADVILGIHRPGLIVEELQDDHVQIGILKNRHGQAGVKVELGWDGPTLTATGRMPKPAWEQGSW